MNKKQIFKYLLFLLIFQNTIFLSASQIDAYENKESIIVKTNDSSSTKEKILNLFSNLKDSFYSNKKAKDKKEEVIKNLEKITKYLSIAHTALKIPRTFKPKKIIVKENEGVETIFELLKGNLILLNACKKVIKSTTESEEPIILELMRIIEKVIETHLIFNDFDNYYDYEEGNSSQKKWDLAIAELIKLISSRTSNKLIKNNISNRKIRRITRVITTSMIDSISKEIFATKADYTKATSNFIYKLFIYSWIEFMGEVFMQNIEEAIKETQTN